MSLQIPIRDSNEFVEVRCDELPAEPNDIIGILEGEQAPLGLWLQFAVEYYRQGNVPAFLAILNQASDLASVSPAYVNATKERIALLNSLAAHHAGLAVQESDANVKERLFAEATAQLNKADTIDMEHELTLAGKGSIVLSQGELQRAEVFFNTALGANTGHIPSLLGKARIMFHKGNFIDAAKLYQKVLDINRQAPANVRLGLALCYHRLNRPEAAKMAFERVLQLDPNNADALTGLAILRLNRKGDGHVRDAMTFIKRAYAANPRSTAVLTHLANHFFYRKQFEKSVALALKAFHSTQVPQAKGEACFQMARAHHAMNNYEKAFQYYYQSVKHWPENLLSQYGLGQMYVYKGETADALSCFEKVRRAKPDNYEAMLMVGSLYASQESVSRREEARQLLQRCTETRPSDAVAWLRYAALCEKLFDYNTAQAAYLKGAKQLRRSGQPVRAALHNNVAVLASMQKKHDQALEYSLFALGSTVREVQGASLIHDSSLNGTQRRDREVAFGNKVFADLAAETKVDAEELIATIEAKVNEKVKAQILKQQKKKANGDDNNEETDTLDKDSDELSALAAAKRCVGLFNEAKREQANHDAACPWGTMRASLLSDHDREQLDNKDDQLPTPPLQDAVVTALFNYARACEAAKQTGRAAVGYLAALARHPFYVDAAMRLGVMARNAGEMEVAETWFERVLKFDKKNAEALLFHGTLQLSRSVLASAQKSFETVLKHSDKKSPDPYATLAMGNIFYIASCDKRDKKTSKKYLEYAWDHFWRVLRGEPRNAIAANGVALVMAERGYFAEAKDFFFQVREAVSENASVWINLAHVYMHQGQFVTALKMYTTASRKFYQNSDPQLLLWIARAFYEDNKFAAAKKTLQTALMIAPGDVVLRFNLALAQESNALATLNSPQLTLADAHGALNELDSARSVFEDLVQRIKAGEMPETTVAAGFGLNPTSIGVGGVVNSTRIVNSTAKSAAKHVRYCETMSTELQSRVAMAEETEAERERVVAAQREKHEAAMRARQEAEAAKLAAATAAAEEEARQLAEDQAKMNELRERWKETSKPRSGTGKKNKRSLLDDDDDDFGPGAPMTVEEEMNAELDKSSDEEESPEASEEPEIDEADEAAVAARDSRRQKRRLEKMARDKRRQAKAARRAARNSSKKRSSEDALLDDAATRAAGAADTDKEPEAPRRRLKRRRKGAALDSDDEDEAAASTGTADQAEAEAVEAAAEVEQVESVEKAEGVEGVYGTEGVEGMEETEGAATGEGEHEREQHETEKEGQQEPEDEPAQIEGEENQEEEQHIEPELQAIEQEPHKQLAASNETPDTTNDTNEPQNELPIEPTAAMQTDE